MERVNNRLLVIYVVVVADMLHRHTHVSCLYVSGEVPSLNWTAPTPWEYFLQRPHA
jgi:hypothetical protein